MTTSMYSVYVLQSEKTGKFYTGFTNNLERRLRQHNSGANKSTSGGAPWKIVYRENFETKKDAWKKESQIKSYKGGEAFKKILNSSNL